MGETKTNENNKRERKMRKEVEGKDFLVGFISKEAAAYFQEMREEARARQIQLSTFALMPDDVEVKVALNSKPRMALLDEVLKAIKPEKMEAAAVHDYTIKGTPLTLKEAYLAGRSDTSRAIRQIITNIKARYE